MERSFSIRFIRKCRKCKAEWVLRRFAEYHVLNDALKVQQVHVRMFFSHMLLYRDLGRTQPHSC